MRTVFLQLTIICSCGYLSAQSALQTPEQLLDSLIKCNRSLVGQLSFEEAFRVIETAENVAKGAFGDKSAAFATCLFYRGRTFFYQGKYPEAEPLYLHALAIQKSTIGSEHADYASTLNGLGNVYREIGQYEKASPYYLESLKIRERVLGKTHPLYASSLNNLASLYWTLGAFDQAESLYLDSKAIRGQTLGKMHPDYAASLNNLATLYSDMGQYSKSEALFLESMEIKKESLGTEHPDYAASMANLAVLYCTMRQYDKAEPLYIESLKIREKSLGPENREYVYSLGNLADLYFQQAQYAKSEELQLKVVQLRKKVSGITSSEYASAISNLGFLYMTTGRYELAQPLLLESKEIRQQLLGRNHQEYVQSLQNLAELAELQKRYGVADKYLSEVSTIQQSRLNQAVSFMSEKELAEYARLFEVEINRMLNFIRERSSQHYSEPTLGALCYDNLLFYKGYLLTSVNQMKLLTCSNDSSMVINEQLKAYQRQLAKEYGKPLQERDATIIERLEENANTLEKNLSKVLAGYPKFAEHQDWKMIQAKLKPEEAAIEFIHFPCDFPTATDSILYAAILIRQDLDQPKFIPLFEARQLLSALSAGKEQAQGNAVLYGRSINPVTASVQTGFYELIWKNLQPHLTNIKTVYYAASGLLHRISLDAIQIDGAKCLADRFQLVRLGSTRRLAESDSADVSKFGQEAVLYGGILYEADTSSQMNRTPANQVSSSQLSFSQADRGATRADESWMYLPGTEKEVKDIATVVKKNGFPLELFSGNTATEESFKALANNGISPWIIHLATHGFFFPDPKAVSGTSNAGVQPVFKISDHPMIRSGIILAGANQAWKTGKPRTPEQEDGILTAYEISQLNLSQTELVVLSACETGLGDIQGNEGVYGLQRAFKIAGVKYLIMSLWKVPDAQTAQLMTAFYQNWLEKKMEIPEAFRTAQQQLRAGGLDAFYWAGFVLIE